MYYLLEKRIDLTYSTEELTNISSDSLLILTNLMRYIVFRLYSEADAEFLRSLKDIADIIASSQYSTDSIWMFFTALWLRDRLLLRCTPKDDYTPDFSSILYIHDWETACDVWEVLEDVNY